MRVGHAYHNLPVTRCLPLTLTLPSTLTLTLTLARYREGHRITLAEHLELLKENKWTHKEFEAGFQEGVAPKDMSENFLKYEALLRRELAKGKVRGERPDHDPT